MDCKEFQEKIKSGSELTEELLDHKLNCKTCQEWVINELSKAPEGMSNKQWKSTISKFSNIETKNTKSETNSENIDKDKNTIPSTKKNKKNPQIETKSPEEEKSFSGYYFSGLKYGIVFGLAIVVGFSIIQVNNEKNLSNKVNNVSNASDTANISSNTINISIATDSEIIQLPNLH